MAAELLSKGNSEFVNENYQKAIELYTEAINTDTENVGAYCCRAQAYTKEQQYKEAVDDSNSAIKLDPKNSIAYLRKGIALFHQEAYSEAKQAFSCGQTLNAEDNNFRTWIRKCEAEIDMSNPSDSQQDSIVGTSSVTPALVDNATEAVTPLPMPSGPKTKYDWYQTETHVVVTILLKKVQKEDCHIDMKEKSLSATIKLPTGNDYSLELDLAHQVLPGNSTTKIMSTKIEIKLRKAEAQRWLQLEDDGTESKVKQINRPGIPVSDDAVHKYPSSSHYTKNWDKLVTDIVEEEKTEKKEGDAALNDLFQKIYGDGSDETKKAMMKSFYESGGTVLSTNWNEVGAKKVDIKPPDGMEYKKWDS